MIRILIADSYRIMLDGLRSVLCLEADFEVVGQATNGLEAVNLAVELRPDVLIIDRELRQLNGIAATRQILAQVPQIKVIGFSLSPDESWQSDMLRAGAVCCLTKDCEPQELLVAIRKCLEEPRP